LAALAPWRVDNVELHLLAFGQRLEAAVLNVAEMHEHVSACFAVMNPKPLASLNHLTVLFHGELLLLDELKRRIRTKKIPQSGSVFAVSLQEHPELLEFIMPLRIRSQGLLILFCRPNFCTPEPASHRVTVFSETCRFHADDGFGEGDVLADLLRPLSGSWSSRRSRALPS